MKPLPCGHVMGGATEVAVVRGRVVVRLRADLFPGDEGEPVGTWLGDGLLAMDPRNGRHRLLSSVYSVLHREGRVRYTGLRTSDDMPVWEVR